MSTGDQDRTHLGRSSSRGHAPHWMASEPGCPQRSPLLELDPSDLLEVLPGHIPECLQVRLVVLDEQPLKPPARDHRRRRSTPAPAGAGRRVSPGKHTKTLQKKEMKTHPGAADRR